MTRERSERSARPGFRSRCFAVMSHLPRSPQGPYRPVVSAASCYVSIIPGQGLFVVTPSGIEHSRSTHRTPTRTGENRQTGTSDEPRRDTRPTSVPKHDPRPPGPVFVAASGHGGHSRAAAPARARAAVAGLPRRGRAAMPGEIRTVRRHRDSPARAVYYPTGRCPPRCSGTTTGAVRPHCGIRRSARPHRAWPCAPPRPRPARG
jgi:hypothetical protein